MSKNSNTSNIDFSKKDTTDESIDDSKNSKHANEENISKSNVEEELAFYEGKLIEKMFSLLMKVHCLKPS